MTITNKNMMDGKIANIGPATVSQQIIDEGLQAVGGRYFDGTMLNEKYCSSLEKYCKEHSLEYINANPEIIDNLRKKPDSFYLLDHIHPDSVQGVKMYSEAVLDYQKK